MLFIMRHGKTDWNAMHKLQGRTDVPLNEEGRKMAREAHDRYLDVPIDVCFCSPLVRARETAELFLKDRNIPIYYDERLQEMSFGEFEGMENTFDDPNCAINVLFQHPEKYVTSIGGAETFEKLYARTGEFLQEKVEPLLQLGKTVLIVGHGAMNCSIVCQVKGLPIEKFWSEGIEQCRLMEL